jgi:benzodiazapine receptor
VLLWLLILATMLRFGRRDRIAAWLLVPYVAWVTFAGFLNAAFAQWN